jgi:hypothetical protein
MTTDHVGDEAIDFASFDDLVENLARWSGSLPDWAPARAWCESTTAVC